MSALEKLGIRKVAAIGGGVIGSGWAARFALNGADVALYDPDPEIARKMGLVLANARRAAEALNPGLLPPEGKITFAGSIEEAVQSADFVQESLPEREDLKIEMLRRIDAAAPVHAVIGSSTSGLLPTNLQSGMARPERLSVGHPFNPVYLLPLVEVCGGAATSQTTLDRVTEIYDAIGMKPLRVRKEIDGFIADRLLEAVWREALWLVNDGIATTEEIDDAIRYGAGLRWSFMGTFLIYRVAGGEAGMRHFLSQFGPALKLPWTKLVAPELTDQLADAIAAQSDDQAAGVSIRDLEVRRDDCLIAVLKALREQDFAAGEVLKRHGERLALDATPKAPGEIDETRPLRLHQARVKQSWIDYNDHMTESRYLQVFGDATDALLAHIGASDAYVESGFSYYTVETHIRHLDEAPVGEALYVETQVVGADQKRVHLFHSLYRSRDNALIATAEHMLVHVDRTAHKACAAKEPVAQTVARLAAAQQSLEKPAASGRSIALP